MKSNLLILSFLVLSGLCLSAFVASSNTQRYINLSFVSTYDPLADTTKIVDDEEALSDAAPAADEVAVWKNWKTVENHTFGKDRGDLAMIADLNSLHPYFRDKINTLIANCQAKGIELVVVESFRTHAKQSEYYTMGRKYTRSAGGKSKHQYGLAVDLVAMVDGQPQWDNVKLWNKIGVEGEKLGLRWGGRWKSPYDPAHFEWSGGLTTYQLAAGSLPSIPSSFLQNYPCIEDDVKELREHWQLWETEQLAAKKQAQSLASSQTP